jgi:transposase
LAINCRPRPQGDHRARQSSSLPNIAQRLVAAGEVVVDVPAKLSTRVRVYSTGHGTKTDKTDAVATARAAIHSKHLRFVQPDGANEALKLVVDRREQLVATRVQAVARLHRLIRELIPGGARRELTAEKAFDLVNVLEPDDPAGEMRVEMAMEYISTTSELWTSRSTRPRPGSLAWSRNRRPP